MKQIGALQKWFSERIDYKLFFRHIVILLLYALLLIVLHEPLASFLDVFWIRPVLQRVILGPTESLGALGLWLTISLVMAVQIWCRRKRLPNWFVNTLILLGIGYTIFRYHFVDHPWYFYHFQTAPNQEKLSWLSNYVVWDGFLIITLIALIHKGSRYLISVPRSVNQSLFSIESLDLENVPPDSHHRLNKAEFIAEQIAQLGNHRAFAIGIVGKWGTGKTHFVHQIRIKLEDLKKQCPNKVIWFTTWQAPGSSITQSFMERLYSELSGDASIEIARYAKWLKDRGKEVASIQLMSGLLHDDQLPFKQVDDALARFSRKLVIVLDDIDRLDRSEINEVFRLVRSTAGFRNTVYILTYDVEYVVAALSEVCEGPIKAEEYLNKIIQYQFYLPLPTNESLVVKFIELLREGIGQYQTGFEFIEEKRKWSGSEDVRGIIESLSTTLNSSFDFAGGMFKTLISNIREVYTLKNSYLANLLDSSKYEIIDAEQLLLIELLKFKSPKLYFMLRSREIEFECLQGNKREFNRDLFVQTFGKDWGVLRSDTAVDILEKLYDLEGPINGLRSEDHSDWYFDSNINLLTPLEKHDLKTNSGIELRVKLFDLIERLNKGPALANYFDLLPPTTDGPSVDKILEIGFALIEKCEALTTVQLEKVLEENAKMCIEHGQRKIKERLIVIGNDKPDIISYIVSNSIRNHLYGRETFVSNKELALEINETILQYQIINKADYETIRLCHERCIDHIDRGSSVFISKKANGIVKSHIKSNPELFLSRLLRPHTLLAENVYTVDPFAVQIFEGYSELDAFLKNYSRKPEDRFKRHWVGNFVRCGAYHFDGESIIFPSDNQTMFVNKQEQEQPAKVVSDGRTKIELEHTWVDGAMVRCIAHRSQISTAEANDGGTYEFIRHIDLEDQDLIEGCELKIIALAQVKIEINDKVLYEVLEVNKALVTDIPLDVFNKGANKIQFHLTHLGARELNRRNLTVAQNPFAFAYLIQFKLSRKMV